MRLADRLLESDPDEATRQKYNALPDAFVHWMQNVLNIHRVDDLDDNPELQKVWDKAWDAAILDDQHQAVADIVRIVGAWTPVEPKQERHLARILGTDTPPPLPEGVHWCSGWSVWESDPQSHQYPFYAAIGNPAYDSIMMRSDESVNEAMQACLLEFHSLPMADRLLRFGR